jgi:hypothetical protein
MIAFQNMKTGKYVRCASTEFSDFCDKLADAMCWHQNDERNLRDRFPLLAECRTVTYDNRTPKHSTQEGALVSAFKEAFVQECRDTVLAAFDAVTARTIGSNREGWKDCELAALFEAVDAQAKNIMLRQARFVNDRALANFVPSP